MTKTILKAILLWFTAIFTMCYASAVDSLSLTGLFVGLFVCVVLIYSCKKVIKDREELDKLLGNNILKKIM